MTMEIEPNKEIPANIKIALEKQYQNCPDPQPITLRFIFDELQLFKKAKQADKQLKVITLRPYRVNGLQKMLVHRIKFKGRQSSIFDNKIIRAWLFFFNGYPKVPPKIYFENIKKGNKWIPFEHLNIDSKGLLCQDILKSEKAFKMGLKLNDILKATQETIYKPNINSAYDYPLFYKYNIKQKNGGLDYEKRCIQIANDFESCPSETDKQSEEDD